MRHVFAAVALLCLAAISVQGAVIPGFGAKVHVAEQPSLEGTWTSDANAGWTDRAGEPRWQFNLRSNGGADHWGFGIRPMELVGVPAAAMDGTANDVRFSWTREAGTFRFTGSFDRGRGSGRYVFEPSQPYLAAMQGFGYRLMGEDTVRLAVLDVTTGYVRELAEAGYRNVALDELTRMRIHRVSGQQIRELRELGFDSLSTEMLVRLRIHQVATEFVRGLAERGYRGLGAEDLVRMRIHRVSLEEIDQLKALGFGGLGPDELVRFRIHKVTPAFIRELRDVGFSAVTEEQLVRMRIHKVDAQFVRDARADGYAIDNARGCGRPRHSRASFHARAAEVTGRPGARIPSIQRGIPCVRPSYDPFLPFASRSSWPRRRWRSRSRRRISTSDSGSAPTASLPGIRRSSSTLPPWRSRPTASNSS